MIEAASGIQPLPPIESSNPEFIRKHRAENNEQALSQTIINTKVEGVNWKGMQRLSSQYPEINNSRMLPLFSSYDEKSGEFFLAPTGVFVFGPSGPGQPEGGFAVNVIGQNMSPALRDGSTVFVHPVDPPRPGDFVVVVFAGDEKRALIREFVGRLENAVLLKEYDPAIRLFEVPRASVAGVLRISSVMF